MATIGSAVLEIYPSARGFSGKIGQQIGGDLTSAGRAAGVKMGGAIADGLASKKAAVEKAAGALTTARNREADGIGRVKVAEQQLAEVRARSSAKASQIGAAEQRVAKARRDAAAATDKVATATKTYESAQSALTSGVGKTDVAFRQHGGTLDMVAGKLGDLAKTAGIIGGGTALVAAGKQMFTLGNEYTRTLNTMQAVTQATGEQMAQVGARARELGNDITIPGTSAADAAAGMTELAKGGLDVAESMAAAKGTLQLAAAAQIDAASAAEIQSNALNTFQLKGEDAGRVADILANTANAASGEITDFAEGMAQSGLVAAGLGISLEDTSTTLGLFAQKGLSGSDAGTSFKTMLIALSAPSKQQAEAFAELGVKAFDAQGNFVGMRAVTEQLTDAQKRMTVEQFNNAAATAFGTDAVRAANAAAQSGVGGWDSMAQAVGRAGGAADLAASQAQGLPGAIEGVKNFAEGAALAVYDLVDGPLDKLLRGGLDGLDALGSKIGEAWNQFSASDQGQALFAQLGRTVDGLKASALELGPALGGIFRSLGTGAAAAAFVAVKGFATALEGAAFAVQIITPPIRLLSDLMTEHQTIVTGLVLAYAGFKAVPAITGVVSGAVERMTGAIGGARDGIKSLGSNSIVAQMRESFTVGAVQASQFGSSVAAASGTIRAGATGIRASLSSLVGYMGGPFAIGATAAVAGVTFAFSKMSEASRKVDDSMTIVQRATESAAESKKQLDAAFQSSGGKVDDGVIDVMTQKVKDFRTQQESLSKSGGGFWGQLSNMFDVGGRAASTKSDELARIGDKYVATLSSIKVEGGKAVKAFDGVGIGAGELGKILSGSKQEFDTFIKSFAELNPNSGLTTWLYGQRAELMEAQTNADAVAQAFGRIGESSVGAARGVDEAAAAISRFANDKLVLEDAERRANETLDAFAEALRNGGTAAVDVSGKIDTTTAAGRQLFDVVKQGQTSWGQLMAAAKTAAQEQGRSAEDATQAGIAAGDRFRADLLNTLTQMTGNADAAKALLDRYLSTEGTYQAVMDADTKPAHDKLDALRARLEQPWTVAIQAILNPAPLPQPAGANIPLPGILPMPGGAQHGARLPLPAFEAGGRMPARAATDDIFAVTPSGAAIARVNGREWVINDQSSEKYDRELAEINAGTFPKLPGYEQGGRLALDRTAAFLSRESGKAYQYGGVGNPSWDCSAYASAAYALMTGRDPYQRWFTTESNFSALGLRPGLNAGAVLNLGVMNGGGGMNSHMAGTLNGVPFESGSNGVRYGSGALGANNPSLPNRWHLPNELASPPIVLGNYTSAPRVLTESDRIELERARLAVDEARKKRDNPKDDADDNDRRSADLAVREAENRLAELEQRQRGGKTAAPEAPALVGTLTDEQMEEESALISRDEAIERRNEVYANPDSTPNDMRRADQALRQAEKALDELREEQLSKGSRDADGRRLKTFTELGSDLGGILAGGLLETFGLEDSILADPNGFLGANSGDNVRTTDKLPRGQAQLNVSPLGQLSQAEALSQAPFVWDPNRGPEQLLDIPGIKLFDNGGKLRHNSLGLNLSGEDESVLTGAETREWKRGNAAVDTLMREIDEFRSGGTGSGGGDAPLIGEWHSHGPDARTITRELEMKLEARMGSSLGRYRA